jgi:hypothetical protein
VRPPTRQGHVFAFEAAVLVRKGCLRKASFQFVGQPVENGSQQWIPYAVHDLPLSVFWVVCFPEPYAGSADPVSVLIYLDSATLEEGCRDGTSAAESMTNPS